MRLFNKKISETELVPILVLCIAISTVILIPSKIIGYGYLPPDDALRHSAKVVSGKEWNDILVLRDDIKMDSHPGWHAILGAFYKITNFDTDSLVVFSIIFLFSIFCLIPIFILERPEAWLMSLLAITVVNPSILMRLFLGRPYIFTMALVLILCFTLQRFRSKKTPYIALGVCTLLVALSTWIHCAWYLLFLPIFCFFMAREWLAGIRLSISIVIGIIIGSLLSGYPYLFLNQTFYHAVRAFSNHPLTRMLVGEFNPFTGDVLMVMFVFGMLAWRALRGAWNKKRIDNPVFILAITGWVLGFISIRFWVDWGIPAILVWTTMEFNDFLKENVNFVSWRRFILTIVISGVFYISLTSDANSRWTINLTRDYLSFENPKHREWLPDKDGIIYSDSMRLFYDTFFKNPHAPWRYILGFEPTMMPEEDLETFRKIQWNFGADEAYEPWVKKMRPQDRLIIMRSKNSPPNIPELEWNYAATGIWIGRLPK